MNQALESINSYLHELNEEKQFYLNRAKETEKKIETINYILTTYKTKQNETV